MDLMDTPQDSAFRDEIKTWLQETLNQNTQFRLNKDFAGTIDDQDWELRIEWEKLLGKAKWLGLSWPEEYGGRNASVSQLLIFHEEYAKSGAPARANFFGEGLFAPTLLLYGSEEQKQYYLPRIQSCEDIWCQGYSEPNAGSDLAGIKTKGVKNSDGEWVINGQKTWSTLAHKANMCFVVTRTDTNTVRPQEGLSFLLVPMTDNGVEVRPIKQITGASEFNEIFFNDSKTSAVLGDVGNGWKVAMATLGFERATAFLDQQAMFFTAFNRLVEIVKELGVNNDLTIRQGIVKSNIGLHNMKLTAMRTLPEIVIPGQEIGPRSSVGKLIWTTWYKEFGELVSDVLGASGMVVETSNSLSDELRGISKVLLDSLGPSIFAGTTQVQKDIVGTRVLGLPR
jgi:alkylation response protein AidB-like acyl-CoA dehydrogenase